MPPTVWKIGGCPDRMSDAPNNTVAVDVDGTLFNIRGVCANVVKWVEEQRAAGKQVICWSSRGEAYARRLCENAGIAHLFQAIIGKPILICDDRGWAWIRFTKTLHPLRIK